MDSPLSLWFLLHTDVVNYAFCLAHFHKYLKVCLLLWAIWFLLIRWHYTITCRQTRCCHFDNWSQCRIVDNISMLRIILFVLAVLCSKIETTIKYHIYRRCKILPIVAPRSVTPAIVAPVSSSQNIASPHTNLKTEPQICLCYQGWKYKD